MNSIVRVGRVGRSSLGDAAFDEEESGGGRDERVVPESGSTACHDGFTMIVLNGC